MARGDRCTVQLQPFRINSDQPTQHANWSREARCDYGAC
jgi:hypothetical protein